MSKLQKSDLDCYWSATTAQNLRARKPSAPYKISPLLRFYKREWITTFEDARGDYEAERVGAENGQNLTVITIAILFFPQKREIWRILLMTCRIDWVRMRFRNGGEAARWERGRIRLCGHIHQCVRLRLPGGHCLNLAVTVATLKNALQLSELFSC